MHLEPVALIQFGLVTYQNQPDSWERTEDEDKTILGRLGRSKRGTQASEKERGEVMHEDLVVADILDKRGFT